MTGDHDFTPGGAAALRRAFDQSFSEPPVGIAPDMESLLAFRAAGHGYAVRLAEISGLFAGRTTVRLPGPLPEFLGVCGIRNEVVPVYSLRVLLGHGSTGNAPRWLMIARAPHPVALAFEDFEGHLRVLPSAVLPSRNQDASQHASASVRLADGMRGVVSIGSLLKTIEERIHLLGTPKEQ